jgi:hypothetical protein
MKTPASSFGRLPTRATCQFPSGFRRPIQSAEIGKKSSAELAEEIAKRLSKHHVAYETAFGRAS